MSHAVKGLGWIALIGLLVGSCSTDAFGNRSGEHETLVAAIDAAERILVEDLDRVFGNYEITGEGINISRCDPYDKYQAGYSVTLITPGMDRNTAYDGYIEGRRGLDEVIIEGSPHRAAGFEIDGIAGQMAIFDHEGEDLRIAANTGCYEEGAWGVDDPYTLDTPRP